MIIYDKVIESLNSCCLFSECKKFERSDIADKLDEEQIINVLFSIHQSHIRTIRADIRSLSSKKRPLNLSDSDSADESEIKHRKTLSIFGKICKANRLGSCIRSIFSEVTFITDIDELRAVNKFVLNTQPDTNLHPLLIRRLLI